MHIDAEATEKTRETSGASEDKRGRTLMPNIRWPESHDTLIFYFISGVIRTGVRPSAFDRLPITVL